MLASKVVVSKKCLFPFPSLKFNSLPLKNDGWKTTFLLGWYIFSGYVKLQVGRFCKETIADYLQIHSPGTIHYMFVSIRLF